MPLYGGGHNTASALDFTYWCLTNTRTFFEPGTVFVPPKAPLDSAWPYQTIASCVEQTGVPEFPTLYAELIEWLSQNNAFIPTTRAAGIRGAIFLNGGTVSVSLGDRRRLIVEEDFRLAMRWMDKDQNFITTFEHAALVPGVTY